MVYNRQNNIKKTLFFFAALIVGVTLTSFVANKQTPNKFQRNL
jgi:hypothetical protein